MSYFAIVSFGGANTPTPKAGPYKSESDAMKVVKKFHDKHGHLAGSFLAATSCRLYEYTTKKEASDADISDSTNVLSRRFL